MIRQIAPQFFSTDLAVTVASRALDDTEWGMREFVVKDCDGRLLAFGADQG